MADDSARPRNYSRNQDRGQRSFSGETYHGIFIVGLQANLFTRAGHHSTTITSTKVITPNQRSWSTGARDNREQSSYNGFDNTALLKITTVTDNPPATG